MAIRVRTVSQLQELTELEPVWMKLFHQTQSPSPFMSWSWVSAWLAGWGQNVKPLVYLYLDEDVPKALLALRICTRKLALGRNFNVVEFLQSCTQTCPDHLGFLGERNAIGEAFPAIMAALNENKEWHGLDLRESDETFSSLVQTHATHLKIYQYPYGTLPYLKLPKTWEDYLNSMSSKSRETLRRKLRQSEKQGCKLEILETTEAILGAMADLFRLHDERWSLKTSSFSSPSSQSFQRQFIEHCGKQKDVMPILFLLRFDQKPIAALYAFQCEGTLYYYQAGRTASQEVASSGQVLMAQVIKTAIERQWRVFDFLRGDEAYKARWTETLRYNHRIMSVRNSMLGQIWLVGTRVRQLLKQGLQASKIDIHRDEQVNKQ